MSRKEICQFCIYYDEEEECVAPEGLGNCSEYEHFEPKCCSNCEHGDDYANMVEGIEPLSKAGHCLINYYEDEEGDRRVKHTLPTDYCSGGGKPKEE